MIRRSIILAVALLAATAGTCRASSVQLDQVGTFAEPTYVTEREGLVYVVERAGTIRVLGDDTPLLDLSDSVLSSYIEDGLLCVAFRPDSRFFYVYFTNLDGSGELDEFKLAPGDPTRVKPGSQRQVLVIPRAGGAHNGGQLQFGPHLQLFISVGDGEDPGAAQSKLSLRGKLLRIDPQPHRGHAYSTPSTNPYKRQDGRNEIFARGFRNPWRFSLDGPFIAIGDVGKASWEEIDYGLRGDVRGQNFGWPFFEGNHPFWYQQPPHHYVPPIHEYPHGGTPNHCSVTGGYVIRDRDLGDLLGRYLYGDWCAGELRTLIPAPGGAVDDQPLGVSVPWLGSFGEGAHGQLYAVSTVGPVYRIEPAP